MTSAVLEMKSYAFFPEQELFCLVRQSIALQNEPAKTNVIQNKNFANEICLEEYYDKHKRPPVQFGNESLLSHFKAALKQATVVPWCTHALKLILLNDSIF